MTRPILIEHDAAMTLRIHFRVPDRCVAIEIQPRSLVKAAPSPLSVKKTTVRRLPRLRHRAYIRQGKRCY